MNCTEQKVKEGHLPIGLARKLTQWSTTYHAITAAAPGRDYNLISPLVQSQWRATTVDSALFITMV